LYWQREGHVSLEDIERRFKKPTALDSLIGRFISVNDGFISVSFLDEQFTERQYVSTVNSENGKKGGRPKSASIDLEGIKKPTANRPLTDRKANESQEEVNKKKKKKFTPPSILLVKEYFIENGYTEASAIKAFQHYDVADWHDSNGKKVVSWKQKMQSVWFKPENKAQSTQPQKASNKGFMPARYDARGNMIIEPNKVLKNDTFGNPWGWFDPE
jgi:hypothetical protein